MKIEQIKLNNFRIYKGENEITFNNNDSKNISLIAGKNGFGKTTFLTSLIWAFYGGLMSQVEDKYKRDIKNAGGYENFLKTLINKSVLHKYEAEAEAEESRTASFFVEVHLVDVLIPSIPCKKVVIRRFYNHKTNKESLKILIDGHENELTKEVGYEVFINDFILPREIAKFFFFDAEKIVSLAEAKSKSELRTLSKAYSEVLGIKKYEDLKLNLNTLLTKLRRSGVAKVDKSKLDKLVNNESEYKELTALIKDKQTSIEDEIASLKLRADNLQEKLIREGNEVTLEELKELKSERDLLKANHFESKQELKKLLEIVPLVIAGKKLKQLINQINNEVSLKNKSLNSSVLKEELKKFSTELSNEIKKITTKNVSIEIESAIQNLINSRFSKNINADTNIVLDFDEESSREIIATYNYIKDSFNIQFKAIVKEEKDTRQSLTRVLSKIKQAEARKDNPLAQKLRDDKLLLDDKIENLYKEKEGLVIELAELNVKRSSNQKVLSEYEKNYKLVSTDKKKHDVTVLLLEKLNVLTARIKEQKKYSLQKSIMLGLNKLMHKNNFITNVNVIIDNDIMDIELLGDKNKTIDKDTLSKGEQQLYATALLKALVDESGINFPVFIDSPLQKFDKEHSSNVIQQFYPTISEQVVLFPLLEKELSVTEYDQLKPNLNSVYLIDNDSEGSSITEYPISQLFSKFNNQNNVFSN